MRKTVVFSGMLPFAILSLAACQVEKSAEAQPAATAPVSAKAVAGIDGPSMVSVERDHFNFHYSWPSEASGHPALNAYFKEDAQRWLGELEGYYAEDDRMKDPKAEFKPTYETEMIWKTVANTDQLLSVTGRWNTYNGGAHGMYGVNSQLFDTKAGAIFASNAVLADRGAFLAGMEEEFCRLLDTERAARRQEPVVRGEMFGECINPLEQTMIWKGTVPGKFDRLEIFVGPYEAGPYAEGSYAYNLPVNAQMLSAISPQYRDNFAVNGGNAYAVEDE